MRLVRVGVTQLTDQELAELAAQYEATEPDHAAELRRVLASRLEHPNERPPEATGRGYLVLRGGSRRASVS
jgi:hypothetical protein